jgi:hypothetical protein
MQKKNPVLRLASDEEISQGYSLSQYSSSSSSSSSFKTQKENINLDKDTYVTLNTAYTPVII